MPIPSESVRSGPFTLNGVSDTFGYGFRIISDGDLAFVIYDASGARTVVDPDDYEVTGVGNDEGGDVVFSTPPSAGTGYIVRAADFTQLVEFSDAAAFRLSMVEQAVDRAAMRDLELLDMANRSLKVSEHHADDNDFDATLPPYDPARPLIGYNASGDGLESYGNDRSADTVVKDGASRARPLSAQLGAAGYCPEDFGYGDPDKDNQEVLQEFMDFLAETGEQGALLPGNTYEPTDGLEVFGDGSSGPFRLHVPETAVIDWSGATMTKNALSIGHHTNGVSMLGGNVNPLASHVSNNATEIEIDAGIDLADLVVGQRIAIMDIGDYSQTGGVTVGGSEDYYRQGYIVPIDSIDLDNNIIGLAGSIEGGGYLTSNANVRIYILPALRPVSITGAGEFRLKQGAVASGITIFDGTGDLISDRLRVTGTQYIHVALARCYAARARPKIVDTQPVVTGWNYGVWMAGCVDTWVDGHIDVPRHAVSLSGGDRPAYAPNRSCGTDGGYYRSRTSSALDMHGTSINCEFRDGKARGYLTPGGMRWAIKAMDVTSNVAGETGMCIRLRDPIDANGFIGAGTILRQAAAVDGSDALIVLEDLGLLGGGDIVLDGIHFEQGATNGERAAVRIKMAAGSNKEVGVTIRNLTHSALDGITPTTVNVEIVGDATANSRYKHLHCANWEGLVFRSVDGPRSPIATFVNIACEAAPKEARYVAGADTEPQDIVVEAVNFRRNSGGGCSLGGTNETDPVRIHLRSGLSIEHAQDAQSVSKNRGAFDFAACDTVILGRDLDVGDAQSVQTMTRRFVFTDVRRVVLPPITSRGVILPDVLSGVNVLEGQAPILLGCVTAQVSHTGNTSETALATFTIPRRALGPNGIIEIDALFGGQASANDKVARIRLNGVAGSLVWETTQTTNPNTRVSRFIANRNNAASQIVMFNSVNSFANSANALVTLSVDTAAADVDLVLTGQLETAGESVTLEFARVWLTYKP